VPTECVTEAESEGGLGGCCGAIEDEVRLEKRGTGERSVTGRGPHMNFSICQPRGARNLNQVRRLANSIKTTDL
jgi:hypothetical protein